VAGSTKNIADNLPTAASKVQSAKGRLSAEHCLNRMFVRCFLPASARAVSTIPATGSVYMTDPVGPTMHEIVSDGSPLPPPMSSTFWPIAIRASSTRPDVNGANICAISTRYLSQYRAEICHASRALFCSSGIIEAFIRQAHWPLSGRVRAVPRSAGAIRVVCQMAALKVCQVSTHARRDMRRHRS
jgi:hypothetical protein